MLPSLQPAASSPDALRLASASSVRVPAVIACRQTGIASEVWIDRQIAGFKQIQPQVVCWGRDAAAGLPREAVPSRVLPFALQPAEGRGRWMVRLRNAPQVNFYGAVGGDRAALRRALRETNAKVVLCHFGHVALRVLPAALDCGVPLVAHFHGLDVSSALRNRWYRWSLLRHLHEFAAIVVVGSHQRRWMLEQGVPENRIHLIPCGVPTGFFTPPARKTPAGRIRILAVSRLVPWKGVAETIRAVALIREHGVDAELTVVGDGDQRAELETLATRLDLRQHVHFLGALAPADVRQRMSQSDIFVQHSLTHTSGWCEGFGVSIAEAASMALPVVATRSGGIPDQVLAGQTGLLVEERDVPAMAGALLRLARDPQLRTRLGAAGRQRMIECFDTTGQIARLERVMLEAARSAR